MYGKMIYSYNVVNGYKNINFALLGGAALLNIIINLILIPKYGILIDYYDAIELINNKADEDNSNFTIGDIEKFGALLREVNPIIEADKENNDEDSN